MAPGRDNDNQPSLSAVSEQDWLMLNAYADDALSSADRQKMAARLDREPALKDTLQKILATKARMRALYPVNQAQADARTARDTVRLASGQRRLHRTALAAGLAALIAGAAILAPQQQETGPIALADQLHETFMAQDYAPFAPDLNKAALPSDPAMPPAPDLTFAGLALADHQFDHAGRQARIGFHYRGRNGCSLTVFLYQADNPSRWPETDETGLSRSLWRENGYLIATLSKGMSEEKFRDASHAVRQSLSQWFRRDDNLIAQLPVQDYPPCA